MRPSPERLAEVFVYDPNTGALIWRINTGKKRLVGKRAGGCSSSTRYWRVCIDYHQIECHVVAWAIMNGRYPENEIDHINGDRADNRAANLRPATRSENQRNTKIGSSNRSGYKGVSFCGQTGRWRASIKYDGVARNLGRFLTKEEAAEAYKKAAVAAFGEFART